MKLKSLHPPLRADSLEAPAIQWRFIYLPLGANETRHTDWAGIEINGCSEQLSGSQFTAQTPSNQNKSGSKHKSKSVCVCVHKRHGKLQLGSNTDFPLRISRCTFVLRGHLQPVACRCRNSVAREQNQTISLLEKKKKKKKENTLNVIFALSHDSSTSCGSEALVSPLKRSHMVTRNNWWKWRHLNIKSSHELDKHVIFQCTN